MAKEIHEKTVEVMRPEIEKLKEFYKYQQEAVKTFSLEIQRLANKKTLGTECIFQTTKLLLGKMLNMFAVLDRVMGVKSSLKTDFSIFNRAEAISGGAKAAGQFRSARRKPTSFLTTDMLLFCCVVLCFFSPFFYFGGRFTLDFSRVVLSSNLTVCRPSAAGAPLLSRARIISQHPRIQRRANEHVNVFLDAKFNHLIFARANDAFERGRLSLRRSVLLHRR